jgi:hypothetical protein
VFEIELSIQAKFDLDEFIKQHKLTFSTKLTTASRPIRCRFENRIAGPTSRFEEVISQFHPLVRMVSARIKDSDEQLTPAVALILSHSTIEFPIQQGIYILVATKWSFHGLQDTEKLAYCAALLDRPEEILEPDDAERLAVTAISNGDDWLEARNVVNLEHAYHVANEVLFGKLDNDYETFLRELRARNEDRADIQLQTLELHLQRQKQKLNDTMQKHHMHGRSALVKATEGRIRALQGRVEQQRIRIESRREVRSDTKEITIAIIKIK